MEIEFEIIKFFTMMADIIKTIILKFVKNNCIVWLQILIAQISIFVIVSLLWAIKLFRIDYSIFIFVTVLEQNSDTSIYDSL